MLSEYRYTLERGPWLNGTGRVLFVMLNHARKSIEAVDDLGRTTPAKGWAPVIANGIAALSHALCDVADAIRYHADQGAKR